MLSNLSKLHDNSEPQNLIIESVPFINHFLRTNFFISIKSNFIIYFIFRVREEADQKQNKAIKKTHWGTRYIQEVKFFPLFSFYFAWTV